MDVPQLMNIHAGSDPNQAMVLIYGYTNERLNHPACFTSQLALLTQLGWRGSVHLLWWDSSNGDTWQFRVAPPLHWRKVRQRAERVGIEHIGTVLKPLTGRRISLIAYSLGARVAYYGLLNAPNQLHFQDLFLFGGAIRHNKPEWPQVIERLRGRLFNLYSDADHVLSRIYRLGELRREPACGSKPIAFDHPRLRQIDVSGVNELYSDDGHQYWEAFKRVMPYEPWPDRTPGTTAPREPGSGARKPAYADG